MDVKPPIERFYDNIEALTKFMINLITRLKNQGHTDFDPNLIEAASLILKALNHKTIIEGFILQSQHYQCIGGDIKNNDGTLMDRCRTVAQYGKDKSNKCAKHKLPDEEFRTEKDVFFASENGSPDTIKQPYNWDKIKERDEKFMAENAHTIFTAIPAEKIAIFRDILLKKGPDGKYIVSDADREMIWKYLEALVKISLHYVHESRDPFVMIKPDGNREYKYKKKFMINIDIQYHGNKWDIMNKLKWQEK